MGFALKTARVDHRHRAIVPTRFSFLDDPGGVLRFIGELEEACRRYPEVVVDFRKVTHLTNCALLLLLSQLFDDDHIRHDANITLARPRKRACQHVWDLNRLTREDERGVEPDVNNHRRRRPQTAKSLAPMPKDRNFIMGRRRTSDTRVNVGVARELILCAMQKLCNERRDHTTAYRTLVECMSNTFKHADPDREAHENWWLSSYAHPNGDHTRWCFAFVDNGVGILKSLRLPKLQRITKALGLLPNTELMKQLLTGELGSRTGLAYRGKGLPGICTEVKRGRLFNATIISNDVRVNLATNQYVTLDHPFPGTFLYWEVTLPPVL